MAPPARQNVHLTSSTRAPDPRASEEMRSLMQSRLALLGLVTFCLGGGFLALAVVLETVMDGPAVAGAHLAEPRRILNLVGATISLLVWLSARSGRRSPTQLVWIDTLGTVSAVVPYTMMSVLGRADLTGILLAVLTLMLVLQTRALLVPSDAGRTFRISLFSAVLAFTLAIGAHLAGWARGHSEHDLPHLAANLAMWLVVIVAVSTVASWVLFGLRAQVHEARRLGQYTLVEKIGQGGMGMVYRARHALLRRPTAIKLLAASSTADGAVARFEREVQLTASLVHPNTVTVFDYGTTPDGVFYYAMEYLDGGDLSEVVKVGGRMQPARVVHILMQVAAGLAEAHEIGLIHRDIKPANILLAASGPVADLAKVSDFGLVRELDEKETSGLTQTNTIMGSPLYMAPEAITDPETVDARADIYALGAVGYFLLTAEHVFDGRTIVEICSHHLHTEPRSPSERIGAKLPEMLEEIILQCLAKDREDRPQSAEELRELFQACDDSGFWSRKDARAWWAENAEAVRAARAMRPDDDEGTGSAPTLAVNLAGR